MKLDFLLLMLLKVTISRHKLSKTVPSVARADLCFLLYVLLYILYIMILFMPEEVKPETSCSNKQEIENKKFRLSFNDILYIVELGI